MLDSSRSAFTSAQSLERTAEHTRRSCARRASEPAAEALRSPPRPRPPPPRTLPLPLPLPLGRLLRPESGTSSRPREPRPRPRPRALLGAEIAQVISIDLIGVHAQRAGSHIEWAIGLVGGSKTIERALYNTTGKALILLRNRPPTRNSNCIGHKGNSAASARCCFYAFDTSAFPRRVDFKSETRFGKCKELARKKHAVAVASVSEVLGRAPLYSFLPWSLRATAAAAAQHAR